MATALLNVGAGFTLRRLQRLQQGKPPVQLRSWPEPEPDYNPHEKKYGFFDLPPFSIFFDIGTSIFESSVKKDSDSWGQIEISSFLRHFLIIVCILKLLTIRIDSGMKFCAY